MKKIISLILLLILSFISKSFADELGTIVASPITVGSSLNIFPSAFMFEIKGGAHEAADVTARDAIPAARRTIGMTCYVISENKLYRLIGGILNSNWADTGTGVWLQNGSSAYYNAGNVGVGTSAPASKVEVIGTVKASAFVGDGSGMTGISGGGGGTSGGWTDDGAFVHSATVADNVGIGTTEASSNKLTIQSNGTTTGVSLQIRDFGGVNHLTVLDNGNVGIGTSQPGFSLDVPGTANFGTGGVGVLSNPNGLGIQFDPDGDAVYEMTFASSGNVGIGTTAPTAGLDATGKTIKADIFASTPASLPQTLFISNTASDTRYGLGINGDSGNDNDDCFQIVEGLALGNNVRMSVCQGGNVGIGTSSASSLLYVHGRMETNTGVKFPDGNTQAIGLTAYPGWTDGGSVVGLTTSSDNVGIGTTATTEKLTINGNSTATIVKSAFSNTPRATFFPQQAGDTGYGIGTNGDGGNDDDDHFRIYEADDITANVRWDLDTNGNVGVGTSAATGRMDIRGDEVRIWTGTGTDTNALASGELYVQGDLEVDGTIYGDGSQLTGVSSGSGTVTAGATGAIPRYTSSTVVDDDGGNFFNDATNIGIGTSTTAGKLTIKGAGTTTGPNFKTTNSSNTALVTMLDNGNVGIGTSVPQAKLSVWGSGTTTAPIVNLRDSAGTLKVTVLDAGNVGIGSSLPGAPLVVFGTGTTTGQMFNMRNSSGTLVDTILDNGNIGIGSSLPQGALDIVGSGNSYFGSNIGIGSTAPAFQLDTSGTVKFAGISTATNDNAVCVDATTKEVETAGNTTCVTSSKRFKEKIQDSDIGLKELMKLQVRRFRYIKGYDNPQRDIPGELIGVIAEEVNSVDSRLIEFDEQKLPRSIHFEGLNALTIKAVQELNDKLNHFIFIFAVFVLLGTFATLRKK